MIGFNGGTTSLSGFYVLEDFLSRFFFAELAEMLLRGEN